MNQIATENRGNCSNEKHLKVQKAWTEFTLTQ